MTFWAERIFFLSYIWHFYDNNCDKTRYHHRCGGLLLLWQKIMKNGLFVLGGPETQLHDILWAVHDGKNHGRSEGEENFGEFPVTVGGRGPSNALGSNLTREIALQATRYWTRAIDRWLLTEPDRAIPSLLLLTEADRLDEQWALRGVWMNSERWRCLWMNRTPWCGGGLDEQ